MARNEEKAQAMLNRWVSMKRMLAMPMEKRPALASQCDSLNDCEKWRYQTSLYILLTLIKRSDHQGNCKESPGDPECR